MSYKLTWEVAAAAAAEAWWFTQQVSGGLHHALRRADAGTNTLHEAKLVSVAEWCPSTRAGPFAGPGGQ